MKKISNRFLGILVLAAVTVWLSVVMLSAPVYEPLQLSKPAEQVLLQKEMTAQEREWKSIYEPKRKMISGTEVLLRYPTENQIYYVLGIPGQENQEYFCDFYVLELSKRKGNYQFEKEGALYTVKEGEGGKISVITPGHKELYFAWGYGKPGASPTVAGKAIPVSELGQYAYVTEDPDLWAEP